MSPTLQDKTYFHNLAHISAKNARIFDEILSLDYEVPVKFWKSFRSGVLTEVRIRIWTSDQDQIRFGGGLRFPSPLVADVASHVFCKLRQNLLDRRWTNWVYLVIVLWHRTWQVNCCVSACPSHCATCTWDASLATTTCTTCKDGWYAASDGTCKSKTNLTYYNM